MEKMTSRNFYNSIINGEITEEIKAFAKNEIEKLDKKNDRKKNTLSKEQIANLEIKDKIVGLIGKAEMVASEIGQALEISTQKASALCRQLVTENRATVADKKVKGKGSVKAYKAVATADNAD